MLVCAGAFFIGAGAQTLPRDLKTWTLEYSVSGGLAGIHRKATLTQSGELTAENRGSRAAGRASNELMAKVSEWLKVARPAKQKPGPPVPDAMYSSTTISSGEQKYSVELPAEIARDLNAASMKQMQTALLGHWRQSAWKLCTPVTQMDASQIDPPIDDLELRKDGTFSVTWRGGGAHTTDIPHTFIPDYSGTFSFSPDTAHLSMKRQGGIFDPKDFVGEGTITIQPGQLILQRIWFGTRQAKQKPDICELTFVPL